MALGVTAAAYFGATMVLSVVAHDGLGLSTASFAVVIAAPARSAAPSRSAAPAYSTESAPDRSTQAAARRRTRSPRRASSPQGTATR